MDILPAGWQREFPTEEGWWWFYGIRFEDNCSTDGKPDAPELCAVKVVKISNGVMHVADGHFMFESEVGECYFCKMITPHVLPELEK